MRGSMMYLVGFATLVLWACSPETVEGPASRAESGSIPPHIERALEMSGVREGPVAVFEGVNEGGSMYAIAGAEAALASGSSIATLAAGEHLPLLVSVHPNGGTRDALSSREVGGGQLRSASGGFFFYCTTGSGTTQVMAAVIDSIWQRTFAEPSGGHLKPDTSTAAEHDYSDTPAGRPLGTYDEDRGITDANGRWATTYTPSIASGDENVVLDWTVTDVLSPCFEEQKQDQWRLVVRVPDLVELTPHPDLLLAPPGSHDVAGFWYLTPETMASVHRYAAWYREANGSPLVLTAASLIQGGINDIARNWAPWHREHRIGTDVDIDDFPNQDLPNVLEQMAVDAVRFGSFEECKMHFGNHVHCRQVVYGD